VLVELYAEADIRGKRIDLRWAWQTAGGRPGLRLLRRQRAYPTGPADGIIVLDLADLFIAPDTAWPRIARTVYLVSNSVTEGEQRQVEVALYFDAAGAAAPVVAVIAYYDAAAGSMQLVRVEEVSRTEQVEAPAPPWDNVTTLEIWATPGGGAEVLVGQVVTSSGHADGLTPDHVEWLPTSDPAVALDFDRVEAHETMTGDIAAAPDSFHATVAVTRNGEPWRTATLEEALDPDTGDWNGSVTLADQGLAPETVYYYALFAPDPAIPGAFTSDPTWRTLAMATGHYGLDEHLYSLLPALHRRYDEPAPGPLRSFLQIFGAALDQARSQAEGLRGRHDVLDVRADLLPHLARWIGWEPDQTLDTLSQRNDILHAAEVYETVGTLPNLCALINRGTGWECRIKEFVHNVMLTNAPEPIHLWEIWVSVHNGAAWGDPATVTRTDGFDGRPAAVVDAADQAWLFWHAARPAGAGTDRREIWLQRLDGVDPEPRRAMLDAPDDAPRLTYTDEEPAAVVAGPRIWLFWSSNRDGRWNIWARPFDGVPGGAPVRLTDHRADDRHAAAVLDAGGRTWLFWQSNRRGPTDIWSRVHDGSTWGLPARITTATFRHEMPAAALDGAGQIWLFYAADLGDRRNIHLQVFDGTAWQAPEPVTDSLSRDEAPAPVFWNGQMWLFWHSNRDGSWQVWGMVHDGASWGAPFPVTTGPTADKEPVAVVDGAGELRLFWRSQRRGETYRSRTIDTSDPAMLAQLGTFQDRAHYLYDTSRENEDWYARDAVGLYLTPDTADAAEIQGQLERVGTFVEPFRPLPARFVWILDMDGS
jgi:phage tail-like protein